MFSNILQILESATVFTDADSLDIDLVFATNFVDWVAGKVWEKWERTNVRTL